MARRHCSPTLECLEGRIALSTVGTAPLLRPHHVALNGEVNGPISFNSGTGVSQTLTGAGAITPLGAVNSSGTMKSTGSSTKEHATGLFTFSNADGGITIKLTSTAKGAVAILPRDYTYKIVGSTGSDAGAKGSGKATLDEVIADALAPSASPTVIIGPIFGLTLHSA